MNSPSRPERTVPNAAPDRSPWFPALEARPDAALRLIAFPYAGAGAPAFRAWPGMLPASIELRVVQLPGRGPRFREDRLHAIPTAIDALEQNFAPYLDRPFAFFGHSLGAVLAFELARRLHTRGKSPVHLFLSGRNAPRQPSPFSPIHHLPGPQFLERVKQLNGMAQGVLDSQELLDLILPLIRSDFTLLESYEFTGASPSLSCPVTALGGDHDPQTSRAGLEAWRPETTGDFRCHIFPGDHFFLDTARSALISAIIDQLASTGLLNGSRSLSP